METTNVTKESQTNGHFNPSVRLLHIPKLPDGSCGFKLSRSKYDPYPWISFIDKESPAENSGLKNGDCVLEVNSEDIIGMRIVEVANIVRSKQEYVTLLLWNSGIDINCNAETLCCGPMTTNLERLSACVSTILSALECPVCLDTIPPPVVQCQNGHLICANCRSRSERCPVCRERYVIRRSLIAEQVLSAISNSFNLCEEDGKIRERLFGIKFKKKLDRIESDIEKPTKSHTHTFLKKIMGKAISVDDLSTKKEVHLGDNTTNMLKTKSLSLSTSEIFRPDTTISIQRCPSARSTHGLSSSHTNLNTKRPTSCNVSTEHLQEIEEDVIQIPVPFIMIEQSYCCPCGENCDVKLFGNKIEKHITEEHKVPIILFGTSTAKISLPPKLPVENSCLILLLDSFQFWVKLILNSKGDILVPALLKSSEEESSNFILEAVIRNSERNNLLGKELIIRSPIYGMKEFSLKDIVNNPNVISYSQESLQTTFKSETELVLTVTVKRVSDL